MQTVAVRLTRHDQAVSFDDAVPADWSVEHMTEAALPRLRLATRDIATDLPLRYSAFQADAELPRSADVGTAVRPGGKVVIAPEYRSARG